MRSSSVNPIVHEDKAGTMYVGYKGVITPFGNAGNKKLTAKGIVFIAVFAAAVILIACVLAKPKAEVPMYRQLHSNIGKNIEVVAEQLDVQKDTLVLETDGVYRAPEKYKYAGMYFDLILRFDEHEGLLNRFEYRSTENLEPKNAAKSIAKISKELSIGAVLLADGEEVELSNKNLLAYFEAGKTLNIEQLALHLGKADVASVSEYCDYLENAEYWEGRVGKYLTRHAYYYEDLYVEYDPQIQEQTIRIICSIEADRSQ